MCELSFGSFNAKCVFPVDRSMQGRCRDSPPASVSSSAQHICIHESKHLRVRMHVLLAECIESWVAFVCFSDWRGGKKSLEKKEKFPVILKQVCRVVLVKWRKKKTKTATKHQEKKPCFNIIWKINLSWDYFFSSWVRSKMKCCLKWKFVGLFWKYQNTTWFSYTSLPLSIWPRHVCWAWLQKLRLWEWGKLSFVCIGIVLLWSLWVLR